MAKKSAGKKGKTKASSRPKATAGTQGTGARLREAWQELATAVAEAQANLETETRKLLKRHHIRTKDGATLMADLGALVDRERRKAAKELRSRLRDVQGRVEAERRGAARGLDDAVRSALAALNIPSRAEVATLTRKVEELAKKVERLKR
jgi:hypothetical protein